MEFMKDTLKDRRIIFAGVTESHFNDNILDAEIQVPDFNIFRQDRSDRKGGGVLMLIHNSIATRIVITNLTSHCDYLVLECPQIKFIIGLIYRSPKCPMNEFRYVLCEISELFASYEKHNKEWIFYLLGDFNWPDVKD